MGVPVLLYGASGTGKTRSAKNFKPDEICMIQCEPKMLPFRGKFDRMMDLEAIDDTARIVPTIKAAMLKAVGSGVKTIIIDDAGYIQTRLFMNGHRALKGNAAFELYNEIGDQMYMLIKMIQSLPQDVIVYIVMHEESDDIGNTKLRTIGKLLDQKVCLEGMVTICIHCIVDDGNNLFATNTDGSSLAKSPEDMFSERLIENDLKAVDSAIRAYYEI